MCSWYWQFIFFCFAFFSIRKHHTLAFWTACCLNDPFGWKKSDQQQIIGFIEISSINGRWSCSHGSCNLKGMIFLNSFWVFPSKTSKQHFRYQLIPLENAWLNIIEHQLRCETSMFVVQKISSHFTDPVGSRSGSKLKPPQKVFFSQKKWWELFGSRVQGTWPSHLFTFHPLKGRPGGPDFNSWYGLVNEHLSTRQTAKKRENISRLGKKAGSWYTEPMEWHNLTIDTDRLAGCLFPAPRILVKLSETEEMNVFFCPFARNESTWCWFLGNLCGDIPSLHAGM